MIADLRVFRSLVFWYKPSNLTCQTGLIVLPDMRDAACVSDSRSTNSIHISFQWHERIQALVPR